MLDLSAMDQGRQLEIIKNFGQNLKNIRIEKKISQRKLADLAELDFSNLNEIENGKINPSLTTIVVLAEVLGVKPSLLLDK